jgi:hypothetical protein
MIRALEARTEESSRTFSARIKIERAIQRFHLWLPSMRSSAAQPSHASPRREKGNGKG